MTYEAQKQPKMAGMKDIVPTFDTLFSVTSISVVMAFSSTFSGEKTTVIPSRIPSRCRRLRI